MALKFHLDSLEMKKPLLKKFHPDISNSLKNIGNAYSCLGNREMAIKYYNESLVLIVRNYHKNHPDFIRIKLLIENETKSLSSSI